MSTDGTTYNSIVSFSGSTTDGGNPVSALVQDSNGILYGLTTSGGNANAAAGTAFSVATDGSSFNVLHSFDLNADGGYQPGYNEGLIQGVDHKLYGTTSTGGNGGNGGGTIFQLGTDQSFNAFYTFNSPNTNGSPAGGLVQDPASGTFYGSSSSAGALGQGFVYSVVPPIGSPPVITSPLSAGGSVGTAFTYTITATNDPASFAASNLPSGFTYNAMTGVISGTPSTAGVFSVGISATNVFGTGPATLTLTFTAVTPFATLQGPVGLAFDTSGILYAANYTGGDVIKVTSNGTVLLSPPFATGFSVAAYPAFDSAGNIYVSDTGNNLITEITPTGNSSTFITGGGLNQPIGVAFDSSGNLYIANYGDGTIRKVTPQGAMTTFVSGLFGPSGLAFDSSGNLYVSNSTSNTIEKISPSGAVSKFAFGLSKPWQLRFDASGNLYVANVNNGTIDKITPQGTVILFASGLTTPTGLAFDSSGNLFASEFALNTIVEFRLRRTPPRLPRSTSAT